MINQNILDTKQERKNQLRNELELKWSKHGIRLVNEFYILEKIVDMEILSDMIIKIRSNGNTFLFKLHQFYPFEGIVEIKIIESDHIDIRKNYHIGKSFINNQNIEMTIDWCPKNKLEEVIL